LVGHGGTNRDEANGDEEATRSPGAPPRVRNPGLAVGGGARTEGPEADDETERGDAWL